jgi:hypothetical protein
MSNSTTFFMLLAAFTCGICLPLRVAGQEALPEDNTPTAQQKTSDAEELLKDLIESIAENLSEDADLSALTERLTYFHQHPIELNSSSPEMLKELFFLTPVQISAFFNYLHSNGPLLDLLELQSIDGFDVITLERLRPFVYLKSRADLKEVGIRQLLSKSNNDLILRHSRLLQERKGFRDLPGSRYLGTPEKLLLRYRYRYADLLSVGLVMEKDPGEQLFNTKTVSDHVSVSLGFYKLGRIKTLVAGDYSMQFGQGLSLWSGFAYGKGPDVTSVAAKDSGVRPYSSSNEASFFRGLASTVRLTGSIDISSFVSYRKLDASLKMLPDGSATLSNINISGLHRTTTELKNQRSLSQAVYGTILQYNDRQFGLAALAYRSQYGHPFTTGTTEYNRYSFTGRQLTNLGLHYQYTFRNYYFYGETAHSLNSGWAIVHGAMASLSSKFSAVLVHRKYEKDYHTFFGQAIGEGTEVNNEEGLYLGLNVMPSRKWTFAVYSDYFRFPWLKYRVDAASSGQEWLTQLNFIPHKRFKLQFRYKTEQKQQNPDAGSGRTGLEDVGKETFRIECNWWPYRKINLQSRLECSSYQKGPPSREYGFLWCQDINYKPMSSRLSGNLRLAWFHTPSYNSRFYAYEDDVLYGASSAIYYGKGIRSFINLRYRLMRQMDVWGRYAIFLYADQKTIGSGLDEITGNKKEDLKLQLRYQF